MKLFEQITYLDEYYLTNAEIDALELHAGKIVARLPAGSRLVELGSGSVTPFTPVRADIESTTGIFAR